MQAALQLGRRAVGAEPDLEAARQELDRRLGLVLEEALQVAPEALVELRLLEVGQLEADTAAHRVVEALAQEAARTLEVLRRDAVVADLLRQPA